MSGEHDAGPMVQMILVRRVERKPEKEGGEKRWEKRWWRWWCFFGWGG